MRIHIEGMGIQGCLLAHFLHRAGIEFTWHDLNTDRTAWKASTGAIYPSGSTKFGPDMDCLAQWAIWHDEHVIGPKHVEASSWWFNHKSTAPHGGKYKCSEPTPHGLRAAEDHFSYHFNAQSFVPETRAKFKALEIPHKHASLAKEQSDFYVISHGWGLRQDYVYWGWTRLVELEYDDAIYGNAVRPCFYFREGRFIMTYAYPVPGTTFWYAGSNIIKSNRSLEMEPKYEKWKANFERLANGAVTVGYEDRFIEGWRPKARDDAWSQMNGNVVEFRPLWNNGIRHFPEQLRSFAEVTGLDDLYQDLEALT